MVPAATQRFGFRRLSEDEEPRVMETVDQV